MKTFFICLYLSASDDKRVFSLRKNLKFLKTQFNPSSYVICFYKNDIIVLSLTFFE